MSLLFNLLKQKDTLDVSCLLLMSLLFVNYTDCSPRFLDFIQESYVRYINCVIYPLYPYSWHMTLSLRRSRKHAKGSFWNVSQWLTVWMSACTPWNTHAADFWRGRNSTQGIQFNSTLPTSHFTRYTTFNPTLPTSQFTKCSSNFT